MKVRGQRVGGAMSQSRLMSLVEAHANVAVGFAVNWVANLVILPWYGFPITGRQAFSLGLAYTGVSVVRSYCLRRVFNQIGGAAPGATPAPRVVRFPSDRAPNPAGE